MIILKTNLELKLTFEKLIQTMKVPVEWNGTFVVVGDYLILPGRVRSLFFNFETRKIQTNIIELPISEDLVTDLGKDSKSVNVLNFVLYAFGKWGVIPGLKVEQDYAKLNQLFTGVLREFAVEPGFGRENFRFYREGIRLTYEDVVQAALDADEKPAETAEEADASPGLWHRLVWKMAKGNFLKTDTTFAQRQKDRLGHNFYMVSYKCPKCSNFLHSVVFPEGKEFRIETDEGGVFLARAYTCNHCNSFYTPRPGKLLAEGDIYRMDFLDDTQAYEDYLDLLGESGDRVSNYKFNEYEKDRNRDGAEEQDTSLEEVSHNIETMTDTDLVETLDKMEEGFYPLRSVEHLERKIRGEVQRRERQNQSRKQMTSQLAAQMPRDGSGRESTERMAGAAQTSGRESTERMAGAAQTSDRPAVMAGLEQAAAGKRRAAARMAAQMPSQAVPAELQPAARMAQPEPQSEGTSGGTQQQQAVSEAKADSTRRHYQAKFQVLDRLSASQTAELQRQIENERNLRPEDKQAFLNEIRERREKQKRESVRQMADSCKDKNYAQIDAVIQKIRKEELPDDEKERFLQPLYEQKKKRGEAEVADIISRIPPSADLKQYQNIMDRLNGYPEVDLSPYQEVLQQKKDQAEIREIENLVRRTPLRSRQNVTDLLTRLGERFSQETALPYRKKLEEKLRDMDQNEIEEICGNPTELSAEELKEAYRKIKDGIFLPELKEHALEMLQKRLKKLKTDECELLVHKLMDALPDRICKNKRYHFYPARKVFLEEATEEEMRQIRYALDTYGTRCELFEYPVVVVDSSGNESGKEGMILTPEHLFYHTKLTAGYLPVASVKKIWGQSGLLNTGLYAESRDGARVKLPYVCDRKELPELGKCLHGFIGYLQEKPESRDVRYLAKEKHRQICCLRCGYRYTDAEGTVCPKCGYKMNQ